MPTWAEVMAGVAGGGTILAAIVAGFWKWLSSRPTGSAAITEAQAAYTVALTTQSEGFIRTLRELVGHQEAVISKLDARVDTLERENELCRGENHQLRSHIDGLRNELIRHGIQLPPLPPLVLLTQVETADGITVFSGRRAAKTPEAE